MTSPRSILIVDDDMAVANSLLKILEDLGFRVAAVAATGEDALRAVDHAKPDLVLMDIRLQGSMDGVEAANQIRERHDLPVVFLTGYGDQDTLDRAKLVGPYGFLVKPIQQRDLNNAIEVALCKHRLEGELRRRERLLDATIRGIADGVIAVDVAGNVVFLNPAAETLLDTCSEESMGLPVGRVFRTDPEVGRASDGRGDSGVAELHSTYLAAGAEPGSPIEYTHTLIHRGSKDAVSSVVVFRDTSLRQRADEAAALRRSEERIRALLEHGSDMIAVLTEEGRLKYASPPVGRILGFEPNELEGADALCLLHKEDRCKAEGQLRGVASQPGLRLCSEWRAQSRDGSQVTLEVIATNLLDNSAIGGIVVNSRDITERLKTEASLRESEKRYRQLYETMAQGVVYQRADGGIISANPAAERILGLTLDQMQGRTSMDPRWRAIREDGKPFPGEDHPSMIALNTGEPVTGAVMGVFHPLEDREKWISVDAVPEFMPGDSEPYQVYTTFVDITERKKSEDKLLHDASYDALTGLANRNLLIDRLRQVVARSRRRPQAVFTVLFLDIDRFKHVNDSLGHHSGDQLLIECAKRLSRCLRGEDTAARLGGDEFVVLLEDTCDVSEAIRVATRIQAELAPPITIRGRELFVTVSIGIVVRSDVQETAEDVLRDADLAMYRAKDKGRARWEIFDATMHERVLARQVIETDLHHVIERSQLMLSLQPIVDIESRRPVCFEALPRWMHPDLGTLFPAEFLPVAKEIGLLDPIEVWVLRKACRQLRAWHEASRFDPAPAISVNVSADFLLNPAVMPRIETILEQACLAPSWLNLEISGETLTQHTKQLESTLRALRSLGIGLYVNDFGTGLSSVETLLGLSFEKIKADQSLISALGAGAGREVVRTVIDMGKRLGLGMIVKGVETAEQLDQLLDIGCDQAQGRFFDEPTSAEVLVEE